MKDQFEYGVQRKAIELMLYQEGTLIRKNYWKRRREEGDTSALRAERDVAITQTLDWQQYLEGLASGNSLGTSRQKIPDSQCMPLTLDLWRCTVRNALNDQDALVARMADYFSAQMFAILTGIKGDAIEKRNMLINEMRQRLIPAEKGGGSVGTPPWLNLQPNSNVRKKK